MKSQQPYSAKKGEIEFRKKIVAQNKGKYTYYPTHVKPREILSLLKSRAQNSERIFNELLQQKVTLSPFLELGGEKCERAAILTSKMQVNGAVIDISADSLESASYFCPKIGYPKLPLRICADLYHLPFADNSVPFVFTFQTLHHFPDPYPVLGEAYRVLSPGGFFYFDEEPIKQIVNLPIWRRDYHLRWWEKILKVMLILPFISLIGKSEVSQGVLEETFSLETWKKALNQFDSVKGELVPFPFGPITSYQKPDLNWLKSAGLTKLMLFFSGGTIKGLCQKQGILKLNFSNINKMLACPQCHRIIINKNHHFACLKCNTTYPIKDNVYYLLPKDLLKKLYPQL